MQISAQLASLSVTNTFINSTEPQFTTTPFIAPQSFVRINTLWSCSLVISLVTASLGILVKQWFHEFMAQGTQDPQYRIRVRFFRNEGLEKWQVFEIAAFLPLLLQVALFLFFLGLSEFLRELNPIVGWTTTGIILTWLITFIFTTLAPIISSQCPYRTPILKRPIDYLRVAIQPMYGLFKRHCIGTLWLTAISAIRASHISRIMYTVHDLKIALPRTIRVLGAWWDSYPEWLQMVLFTPLIPLLIIPYGLTAICGKSKRIIASRLPDTSGWIYTPPPEESKVRDTSSTDLDIIFYSDPFFLDQQLQGTLGECLDGVKISDILDYYINSQLPAYLSPLPYKPTGWRLVLDSATRDNMDEVVFALLQYQIQNSPEEDKQYGRMLLGLREISGLTRWSRLSYCLYVSLWISEQAGRHSAFMALYSSACQESFDHSKMYGNCIVHGDSPQCVWLTFFLCSLGN